MNVKISINGKIEEKSVESLQKTLEKLLKDNFKSFKYIWELNRGM